MAAVGVCQHGCSTAETGKLQPVVWHKANVADHDSEISREEITEILSILPDISGKDVLELGAGKGRFTGHLAAKAKSVECVDFVKEFLLANQERNKGVANITYKCVDVAHLDKHPNQFDLIFSNGLFMYLEETVVRELFERILVSLRPGGHFFFCECCFSAPDGIQESPAFYRLPDVYNSLFQSVAAPTEDGEAFYSFEIIWSKSVQAFVKLQSNCNHICWLLSKVRVAKSDSHGYKTFQEFLDNKQYSRTGILRYERIFGDNFVSTGGIETTEEFVKLLKLKPKDHVLDVGSGIGGGDFYMAQEYDVFVTGIDLSSNMVSIALERANKIRDIRVQFEVCDATKRNYSPETFDVVYSRDTILHIVDKRQLFAAFFKWLKPGGRLLISDYCCCEGRWSDDFTKYVKQRGYALLSVKDYGKLLEDVGFVNVKAEDRTDQFVKMLKKELKHIENIREDFVKEFSESDHGYLVDGWKDKVERCASGSQKWGLFYAEKAADTHKQ